MSETVTRVASVLARVMADPGLAHRVTADTNLVRDLGIDSLQMVNFMLQVEEEFDVEIDYESIDLDDLGSVRSFCDAVLALPHQPALDG